ncbi:hypothetical protein, partial [Streptomyces alkaliterrae]|uniref:hypothetical protein n=1 Tax=Streptomyces alkaliterrae TaxID=2213162 RepID=UPI001E5BFAD4
MSTNTFTTQSGPVTLYLPLEPPVAVAGCEVCAAMVVRRREARDKGDLSAATDADVEIRCHPHRTRVERPRSLGVDGGRHGGEDGD